MQLATPLDHQCCVAFVVALQHHRWQHIEQPIERRPTYVRVDLLLRNGGSVELLGGDQDRVLNSFDRAQRIAKGLRVRLMQGQGVRDWARRWRPNDDSPALAPAQGTLANALEVQAQEEQLTVIHRPVLTTSGIQDLNLTPWVNASLMAAAIATMVQLAESWANSVVRYQVGLLATIGAVAWLWRSSRRRQRIRMSPQRWTIDANRIVGHNPSQRRELQRRSVQWVRVETRLDERYSALKIGGHGQSMPLIEVFGDNVETTLAEVFATRAYIAAFWGLP